MKLYVGNFPDGTTTEEIRALFEPFGIVDFARAWERPTFARLDMPNDEDARNAIDKMDGSMFKGNRLIVNEAEYDN